jgi:hypothetical protein
MPVPDYFIYYPHIFFSFDPKICICFICLIFSSKIIDLLPNKFGPFCHEYISDICIQIP